MFRPKRAPTAVFLAMSVAAMGLFTHFIVDAYRAYYTSGNVNDINIRYPYYVVIFFAPIIMFLFAAATGTREKRVTCAQVCKVSIVRGPTSHFTRPTPHFTCPT